MSPSPAAPSSAPAGASFSGRQGIPVRVIFFSTWTDRLQDARSYLAALPDRDLTERTADPANAELVRNTRLNCDWDGECLRAFAEMTHPDLRFLPAMIVNPASMVDLLKKPALPREARWLIFTGQQPLVIDASIGRYLKVFTTLGGRVLYWAFDEASRAMACFAPAVAPYLSALIHDELPLAPEVAAALPKTCAVLHHSWVANMVPFAHPFHEEVENRIVFLGSAIGLTKQRVLEIGMLKAHFKERFEPIFDYSIPVSQRGRFGRWKVHLCPEGRKFTTPGMRYSATDRPFWSGCLGQVPVVEDSLWGGRLEDLHREGLIVRYPHGNVTAMIRACEKALAHAPDQRRRIYEYFNRCETIGPIAARMIARHHALAG